MKGKCHGREMSGKGNVMKGNVMERKCHGREMSGGEMSKWESSGRKT
jgi:hypothetical protein